MKLFQKRVFLFLFFFVSFIFLDIFAQKYLLYNNSFFKLPNNKINVIFGHSHVAYAYNPKYIDSTVNLGDSGEAYIYTYYKAKKILENNPQIRKVFIEYTNNQIDIGMNNWIWDDMHLKYRLKEYIYLMDFESIKFLFDKNRYGFLTSLSKGLFENLPKIYTNKNISKSNFGGFKTKKYDGFELNDVKIKAKSKFLISESNIYYLKKLIQLCKEKNVDFYLIRTPMHKTYSVLNSEFIYKKLLSKK